MFGLSMGEIVIIAILALLLLGPDKLPDAAKTLGKTMREIRKATEDLKDQVEREIYTEDKPKAAAARPSLVPPVPTAPVPGPAGPPPAASTDNVPGLEAALAEVPAVASSPVAAPAPAPQGEGPQPSAAAPDAGKIP